MRYLVQAESGRTVGALGIFYPVAVIVEAENPSKAIIRAYNFIEHLRNVKVEKIDQSHYDGKCELVHTDPERFYDAVKAEGIAHDHHASDLYLPVTPAALDLMTRYGIRGKPFKSNIDGDIWFDIPFMYAPFWDRKPTTV